MDEIKKTVEWKNSIEKAIRERNLPYELDAKKEQRCIGAVSVEDLIVNDNMTILGLKSKGFKFVRINTNRLVKAKHVTELVDSSENCGQIYQSVIGAPLVFLKNDQSVKDGKVIFEYFDGSRVDYNDYDTCIVVEDGQHRVVAIESLIKTAGKGTECRVNLTRTTSISDLRKIMSETNQTSRVGL